MLSAEENELLTRVGPGTPCGELFRRYWLPIALLPDVSEESPTKYVRVLGEDLVLFRCAEGTGDRGQGTGDGQTRSLAPDPRSQAPVRIGLLADHCPHRGASLLYGRVEERGIACAYHGWLYDIEGNCLETPAEPSNSKLYLTVKHRAYPVEARYGLYWAYLGPPPAPILPRYDALEMGVKAVGRQWFDCNWLQGMENHMDQSHVFILHQDTAQRGVDGMSTGRGRIDALEGLEYDEVPFGIKRRQLPTSGYDDMDLLAFPNVQRTYDHIGFRVPVDDTHMWRYSVFADIRVEGATEALEGSVGLGGIRYRSERGQTKSPPNASHPFATYRMDGVQAQDFMALETQGPIADRTTERLATSDRGIVLYRSMLAREIGKVQQNLDPIGVIRDPEEPPIDTYIDNWIEMIQQFPPDRQPRGGAA